MGDFILDVRPPHARDLARAASPLRFLPQQKLAVMEQPDFGLAISHPEAEALWAPYTAADGSIYAVAGVVAFDQAQWDQGAALPGNGGWAAKTLCHLHRSRGPAALGDFNGNCAIIIYDAPRRRLHLITDRAGAFPVFECQTGDGWVFGSHPDLLAQTAGEEARLDEVSLAEFLISSKVTPPYTFYERIRAIDNGTALEMDLEEFAIRRRRYFSLEYAGEPDANESALAVELADTLRQAIRRRTLPLLGTPAVALSGGLDSRLLLASMEDRSRAFAFTCYDQPNRELETARQIATAMGVRFLPLQRSPDYYAEQAEEGVRVSGGMGTFANNHFLGVLPALHAEGMQVLLTGCYCDYLFKGLSLNRRAHWFTGREEIAPFSHEFYFTHWMPSTPLVQRVRERWEARFPASLQRQDSAASLFDLEVRRTFPLSYEADNQQRVVPQRLTGWSLPVADREVLEVYRRIPSAMKLNRSLFLKAARIILESSPAGQVRDANTGAPLHASPAREWISFNWLRVQRKWRSRRRTLASDGSWPDWQYYLAHSPRMAELWQRPNPRAFDFFRRVMGWDRIPTRLADFQDGRVFLFVPMLSQKIWFEQRA